MAPFSGAYGLNGRCCLPGEGLEEWSSHASMLPYSLSKIPNTTMEVSLEVKTLLKTLPLQIADQLADSITEGQLMPGLRLRETELATNYSVSRATIREALRLLEQRGLVQIQPQRGAHVTQLSAKELYDLFAIRASLLSTGSRLAAENCTEKEAKILNRRLDALRKSITDLSEYTKLSSELVAYITGMSDNVTLATYVRDLAQRIGRYVRIGLSSIERRERSLATWEQLIDAIIKGDGERASAFHFRLAMQNRDAALKEFDDIDETI